VTSCGPAVVELLPVELAPDGTAVAHDAATAQLPDAAAELAVLVPMCKAAVLRANVAAAVKLGLCATGSMARGGGETDPGLSCIAMCVVGCRVAVHSNRPSCG